MLVMDDFQMSHVGTSTFATAIKILLITFSSRKAEAIIASGTKVDEKAKEDQRDTMRGWGSRKWHLMEFYNG